ALDRERAGRAAADRSRPGGLVRLNEGAARLERFRDAHQRSGGAEPVTERRHSALGLLPDLPGEVLAVVRNRIRIVELIGRIMAGTSGQLQPPARPCWRCPARSRAADPPPTE